MIAMTTAAAAMDPEAGLSQATLTILTSDSALQMAPGERVPAAMNWVMSALDDLDPLVHALLEPIGLIALSATRVEFALAVVRAFATGGGIDYQCSAKDKVRAIRRSAALTGAAGSDAARTVDEWATAAEVALNERGELMHSFPSVTSDILDADWIRMGKEPPRNSAVWLTRLRGGSRERTREDLIELADRLTGLANSLPTVHDALRLLTVED